MKNRTYIFLLNLIIVSFFASCISDDKETFTITGSFVDGTHPTNKFANLKLTFEDYHNFKKLVTLGETQTDANGNFKFTYEYSTTYASNYLRIYVDSNFIAAKKLYSLELGSNWNKTFYMGDSALLTLQIDTVLTARDTLLFTNGDSIYTFLGPISSQTTYTIKLLNQDSDGLVGYCIGKSRYPLQLRLTYCNLIGEPIINKLKLF